MFEKIDFESGIVGYYYNDMRDINEDMTIKELDSLHLLDEDLFQVECGGKYVIDIGWYSSFKKGFFKTLVIKDDDWENPIYDKRCRDLKTLNEHMEECVGIVKGLLENESSGMT